MYSAYMSYFLYEMTLRCLGLSRKIRVGFAKEMNEYSTNTHMYMHNYVYLDTSICIYTVGTFIVSLFEVHWRTAGRLELSFQRKQSPLYQLELYEHDKSKPFRAKL